MLNNVKDFSGDFDFRWSCFPVRDVLTDDLTLPGV